jgi:hypothetical protein
MEKLAVVDIVEELLSEFIYYRESGKSILSIRERNCRVPKGTIAERVEYLLSGRDLDSAL